MQNLTDRPELAALMETLVKAAERLEELSVQDPLKATSPEGVEIARRVYKVRHLAGDVSRAVRDVGTPVTVKGEVQTCPSRTEEMGPWERKPNLDTWDNRGGGDYRQCSFCGGIHPDDAIAIIKDGGSVGVTDKSYKRYLGRRGDANGMIKLYTMHFSPAQAAGFNEALRISQDPVT